MVDTELVRRFNFARPVSLEMIPREEEVVATNEGTLLRLSKEALENDMPELLAMVKLAEKDPLLVTFKYQHGYNDTIIRYMVRFQNTCKPLLAAWAYRTLRECAPDLYEKEIEEVWGVFWLLLGEHHKIILKNLRDVTMGLSLFCILYERGLTDGIKLSFKNREAEWLNYVDILKRFTPMPADVNLYTQIPVLINAEYRVSVEQDTEGKRCYNVVAIR